MDYIPEEARCGRGLAGLHDFVQEVDNDEALVESCRYCGKRSYFNKRDGRIDERLYLRTHFRDFLQPVGTTARLFRDVYGQDAVKSAQDVAKNMENKGYLKSDRFSDDMREYAQDTLKTVKRLESKAKL